MQTLKTLKQITSNLFKLKIQTLEKLKPEIGQNSCVFVCGCFKHALDIKNLLHCSLCSALFSLFCVCFSFSTFRTSTLTPVSPGSPSAREGSTVASLPPAEEFSTASRTSSTRRRTWASWDWLPASRARPLSSRYDLSSSSPQIYRICPGESDRP